MADSQEGDLEEELVFDEDDFRPYNMSRGRLPYTGVCLVFNNIHFTVSHLRTRPGSAVDFQRIKRVFKQFGFKVEEKRDFTAASMRDCLRRTAIGYRHNYSAFICFFLSHGKAEKIFGRDGFLVKLSDLIQTFVQYCPQMAGKPKLFFAQICRKCEEVEGATSDAGVDHESVKTAGISIFPCDKNILVSFATTSGRAAYRAATSGSPYIQKLTQVLRERGHKDSIFEVLMLTRRLVEESVAIKNRDMCPEFVSTLTRPLVFAVQSTEITNSVTQMAQDEEDEHPDLMELAVALR